MSEYDLLKKLDSLTAKLAAIQKKTAALLEAEGKIRTQLQRIQIQIFRLRKPGRT